MAAEPPATKFLICDVANYERRGKLAKKSLNSNEFKERHFVLERDHLFYYKTDRQSKLRTAESF